MCEGVLAWRKEEGESFEGEQRAIYKLEAATLLKRGQRPHALRIPNDLRDSHLPLGHAYSYSYTPPRLLG